MTGPEIRSKRKKLNLTIEELATMAGITFVALQHIETGKTKHPHKLTIRASDSALEDVSRGDDVPSPS